MKESLPDRLKRYALELFKPNLSAAHAAILIASACLFILGHWLSALIILIALPFVDRIGKSLLG